MTIGSEILRKGKGWKLKIKSELKRNGIYVDKKSQKSEVKRGNIEMCCEITLIYLLSFDLLYSKKDFGSLPWYLKERINVSNTGRYLI